MSLSGSLITEWPRGCLEGGWKSIGNCVVRAIQSSRDSFKDDCTWRGSIERAWSVNRTSYRGALRVHRKRKRSVWFTWRERWVHWRRRIPRVRRDVQLARLICFRRDFTARLKGRGAICAGNLRAANLHSCLSLFLPLFGSAFRLIFYSWNLFYHPGKTRAATVSCTRLSLRIKLLETNFSQWLRLPITSYMLCWSLKEERCCEWTCWTISIVESM